MSKSIAVAQRAQDGSTAHIVQWQMGQYRPRCAFMVPLAAVNGMLTLPFQILTLLCFNENEADVETESQPYRLREWWSVFENFSADHN